MFPHHSRTEKTSLQVLAEGQNPPQRPPSRWRQSGIFLAKCVLAALLIWWLVNSGRLDDRAWRVLVAPSPSARFWLVGALVFQCAMLGFQAARWSVLTRALSHPISLRHALVATLRGTCVGAWTPAGLGLDGVRCMLLSQKVDVNEPGNAQRAGVLASLLDRVNGLSSLLWICLLAWSPWLGVGALLLFLFALRRLPLTKDAGTGAAKQSAWSKVGVWWHQARQLQQNEPRALWFSWLLAVGTHGCNLGAFVCVLLVLEPNFSPLNGVILGLQTAPSVILATVLPLTPLGLGVADGVAETLLRARGVNSGGEIVMLSRALWLLLCLVCGAAFWLRLEKKRG